MENGLEDIDKDIYFFLSPRGMITASVLRALECMSCTILLLRLYFVTHISAKMSLQIAIFATFINAAVTEVEIKISRGGAMLGICTILKLLSGFLTISIFTINNTVNDYFIGFLFFASTNLGKTFFENTYRMVIKKPYYDKLKQD